MFLKEREQFWDAKLDIGYMTLDIQSDRISFLMVPKGGFEPPCPQGALRPERSVSTNSTTSAKIKAYKI